MSVDAERVTDGGCRYALLCWPRLHNPGGEISGHPESHHCRGRLDDLCTEVRSDLGVTED